MTRLQKFYRSILVALASLVVILGCMVLVERKQHAEEVNWLQQFRDDGNREISILRDELEKADEKIYSLQMDLSESRDLYNKATWTIELLNKELEALR